MRKVFRIIISFILKYSPSEKLSDILLWPVSKRLLKNYEEVVEIEKGLKMRVFGDMPDMVNKSLMFFSGYKELAWETNTAKLVKSLAKKYKVSVIAGSHIGYYPLIISHNNPVAKIYAFEPNPLNYKRLCLNSNKQIDTYMKALGDKNEIKKMYFDAGQSSLVDTRRNIEEQGDVEIVRVDDFLKEERIDFMLLDAEGYELNILKGAVQTIEKYHPDIIFEINPSSLKNAGTSEEELRDFLKNFGYSISDIKEHEGLSFINAFATIRND